MRILLAVLMCTMLSRGQDDTASLRQGMLELDEPPILQYQTVELGHPELLDAAVQDYERMGFNGVQHGYGMSQDLTYGTWLSIRIDGNAAVPMRIRRDGKEIKQWIHFGDIYADENIDFLAERVLKLIETHGESSFAKVEGRIVTMTADEADLGYSRHFFTMVSPHREAAWRRYAAALYADDTPRADSNGDGRTYATDCAGDAPASWDEVAIPDFDQRFAEPRLWIAYRQMICERLYDFVGRVEKQVNEAGVPFSFGFSGHASITWPGGSANWGGADYYLQATKGRILAVENSNARWTWQMSLNYSIYDRMSQQYDIPVFGWSWFWPTQGESGYYGTYSHEEIDRIFGQMYGHELHGLLYWTYLPEPNRRLPAYQHIAYWHHWFRRHWPWLRHTHPGKPDIAILYPKTTALFYPMYLYPKQDYGWTIQALHDLQVPFTVLTEEEVMRDGVGDYKALMVMTAERVPKGVANAIGDYLDAGGHVYTNADSLTLDETGQPIDLLGRFGITPTNKYKQHFQASMLSPGDAAWAKDAALPLPEQTPYGAAQESLDSTERQWLEITIPWHVPRLRTWHDIVTGTASDGARVMATYEDKAAAVETDQTLWLGFRLGADLCATYPEERFPSTGEPQGEHWDAELRSANARSIYTDLLGRFLTRAGVTPPVPVYRDGQWARHIDTYVRRNGSDGTALIILVDTDLEVEGESELYEVEIPWLEADTVAWDLRANQGLARHGDGRITIRVPQHSTAYLLLGNAEQVAAAAAIQRQVDALDLEPKPFPRGQRGGPHEPALPEAQISTISTGDLPEGVLARLTVTVRNPLAMVRQAEPVVLPVKEFSGLMPAGTVKAVRLEGGTCQWDDLDGDGQLYAGDEIVWQADFQPNEVRTFTLDFLSAEGEPAGSELLIEQAAGITAGITTVNLQGRELFRIDEEGLWDLSQVTLPDGTKGAFLPARGFVFGLGKILQDQGYSMEHLSTEIVQAGPVRKTLRVIWACQPLHVVSTTDYTVYTGQPEDEVRVYAKARHDVKAGLEMAETTVDVEAVDSHGDSLLINRELLKTTRAWSGMVFYVHGMGALLEIPQRATHLRYLDAKQRVCQDLEKALMFVNNSGGWVARETLKGPTLQVSLRRLHGVLKGQALMDEHDGVQVMPKCDYPLVRAAYELDDHRQPLLDTRIPPGTSWELDTLLTISPDYTAEASNQRRQSFAAGLDVSVALELAK